METRAPANPVSEEDAFNVMTKDLDTARSPKKVLEHLKALYVGLCDPGTAGNRARSFLLGDGLPAVIRHLSSAATSDGTLELEGKSSAISDAAAQALTELLRHMDAPMVSRIITTAETSALIEALTSAPTLMSRAAATRALLKIAEGQPTQHQFMASAGAFVLVLALYDTIGAQPQVNWEGPFISDTLDLGADPVRMLVRSNTVAVLQLRRSISKSRVDVAFASLVILQVSLSLYSPCCLGGKLTPPIVIQVTLILFTPCWLVGMWYSLFFCVPHQCLRLPDNCTG
jgi:hypothetical protein